MPPINTTVSPVQDLWAQRKLVAAILPTMQWRRHGIGALQGYVHEDAERELRVHIWHRDLMVPGILESGNAHNHRFAMRSRVLAGELLHTEWQLVDGVGHMLCDVYDFKHARAHKTDADRTELSPVLCEKVALPVERRVMKCPVKLTAGMEYTFARGAYHDSLPLTDLVVTLVEKFDQREERARVIAPVGMPPVPAFGSGEPSPALVARLVAESIEALNA